MYKKGDICYYIVSNWSVRQGIVTARSNGLYTVRIGESGAIRLPESRLYPSAEEAARTLPVVPPAPPGIHEPPLH